MHITLTIDPTSSFRDRCEAMRRVEQHLYKRQLLASIRFPAHGNHSLCEYRFRDRTNPKQPDDPDTKFAKRVAVRLKAEIMADSRNHGDGLERIYEFWPERFQRRPLTPPQPHNAKQTKAHRPTCTHYQTFDECGSAWLHARGREAFA